MSASKPDGHVPKGILAYGTLPESLDELTDFMYGIADVAEPVFQAAFDKAMLDPSAEVEAQNRTEQVTTHEGVRRYLATHDDEQGLILGGTLKLDGGLIEIGRSKLSFMGYLFGIKIADAPGWALNIENEKDGISVRLKTPALQDAEDNPYILYADGNEAVEPQPPVFNDALLTPGERDIRNKYGVYGLVGRQTLDIVRVAYGIASPPQG